MSPIEHFDANDNPEATPVIPTLDATGENVPLAGEGAQQTTLGQEETEMNALVGEDTEAPISEPTTDDDSE